MHTLLSKLAAALASLVMFLFPTHAPKAGATIGTGATWVQTVGRPLYDTPSGDLEIGDYAARGDGTWDQHRASWIYSDATTTAKVMPDAITNVKAEPKGMILVHVIGTKYFDSFSDGSVYAGDATVDANLGQQNAALPSLTVDALNGTVVSF